MSVRVRAGRRTVEISSPEKVLFGEAGVTKEELARYYARVSNWMLPHVRARPVSMQRFPEGVEGDGFFHKDVPGHFPDWISRVEVRKRGGTVTHAITCDAATLVYLANQNTITPHVWLSRADAPERPDRIVFDLDPSADDFGAVREAARLTRAALDELGLASFPMTTGSRGLHVTVPLRRTADFDEVRPFARGVAALLADRHPDLLTVEQRKSGRGDRILVDVARNGWAQTAVPPYAVRAKPTAPVATPLEWEEVSDSRLRPDRWTVRDVLRRLERKGDPWSGIGRRARELGPATRRLEGMRTEGRRAA